LPSRLVAATAIAALVACLGAARAGAATVTVEPAFGYRIGDSIVAVARLAVDERAQLDAESLPKVGRLHGWLSLEEVNVEPEPGGGRTITRVFQVTASAPEPRVLYLPKVELRFRLDGRELVEQLESVPVSVAPMAPTKPVLRNGFGVLRPDRDVPAPGAQEALQRAGWLAAALAVLALLWAGLRMMALRRPGYAPFAAAARKLRRLARAGRGAAPGQVVGSGFRIMHEAFNQAAGQAVFSAQRDRFLAEHPQFAGEAARVRAFFDRSDVLFFGARTGTADKGAGGTAGGDVSADDTNWLADLASRLARLEQPGSR
jgi:mxaA protein